MDTQLRKDILAFLTPLPSMQTEKGRRAILFSAGLDAILAQTDLSGPPGVSVPLLVNTLEHYGTIESGEPALVVFLQEIARQVGQDKQRQIQDFFERLQHGPPKPQQSRISEQQTPTEEQERTITAQRDYFEQVGGNVFTGPVNIYQGTPAPASPEPTQKEPSQKAPEVPVIHLRSKPLTVSEEEFIEVFKLDEDQRPREYIQNNFKAQGTVVIDHATGLMWQKSGSNGHLSYEKAQKYVEELNRQKFAGYKDWRLPTIPELVSLLEPEGQKFNRLYISPVFDARQFWCLSADLRQIKDEGLSRWVWGVAFHFGHVLWDNLNYYHYVRAVRSLK